MLSIPWSFPVDHLPSSVPKVLLDSPWNRVWSLVNTGQCWRKQEEYFIAKLPAITWMLMVLKASVWAQNPVYVAPGPWECVSALGLIAHNRNLNTTSGYWELPRGMGAGTVSPLFNLRPWYLLSDHLGPTCVLNGCMPNPVHPHRAEEDAALTCFSGQLFTGERQEGRGSPGHKICTSILPVKAVSGARLSVPVFRTAWS